MIALLLALLLLLPATAWAAIAEVGGGSQRATLRGTAVASVTVAFPANVTSGNLLIVSGGFYSAGQFTVATSDTRSTSYTDKNSGLATGSIRSFISFGRAPSSGADTVTITPSAGVVYIAASMDEFSGVHATPLDVDGGSATGTSTTPTMSITTGVANDLIVAAAGAGSSSISSWTAGSGYTFIDSQTNYGTYIPSATEFHVVGAAGAQTANFTMDVSRDWAIYSLAFKPAAGGASPIRHRAIISSRVQMP